MNFVGPRPERPHFVRQLAEEIPYYEQRHLIAPGLTGWAQINYPYGASIEDAKQKLQYDLYYMKNQSLRSTPRSCSKRSRRFCLAGELSVRQT
jgi:lipopolysaccharide/colanic/teichoic acid biosynthesis glycosyltransferase